jgi:hypothetical protein
MIVSERIVGVLAQDLQVTTNRLPVILDTERVVSTNVADLLVGSARDCVVANPGREQQRRR